MKETKNNLYKYLNFSSIGAKDVIEKVILNGSIEFNYVDDFNDPNEFKFDVNFTEDLGLLKKQYLQINSKSSFDLWKENVYDNNANRIEIIKNLRSEFFQAVRVACFTTNPVNNLMWSHYSNCHKGICVIYKKDELLQHFHSVKKDCMSGEVNYVTECPSLIFPEDMSHNEKYRNKLISTKTLCFKQEEWNYEDEVRIVLYESNKSNNEIYYKVSPNLKNMILEMGNVNGIKVFETYSTFSNYKLNMQELN